MHDQIPSAARDFSPRVNFLCAITCFNICVHVKNPKHRQPYHCLDTGKYYTPWQEWVALLLPLLHLTPISIGLGQLFTCRDNLTHTSLHLFWINPSLCLEPKCVNWQDSPMLTLKRFYRFLSLALGSYPLSNKYVLVVNEMSYLQWGSKTGVWPRQPKL